MLIVHDLEVGYGGITALRRVSMEVHGGETVLLVGANGAGKSSLIKAVIGLVGTRSGSIAFDGKPLEGIACDQRARAGIGYAPEGRRVFASMSVADNVLSGSFGRPGQSAAETYVWLSELFPLLAQRAHQPAGQLSGGEQQVVALARAVSSKPKLLLLDEPFLGLAPIWIARISDAIRELQRRGTTILMTEQMAVPALKLATRGYLMRGGVFRYSGTVDELREAAISEEYL